MKATCGILFSRRDDINDATGCLRTDPHYSEPHLCRDADGVEWEWETDHECDCEDCQSDEMDSWCLVYWRVDKPRRPRATRVR